MTTPPSTGIAGMLRSDRERNRRVLVWATLAITIVGAAIVYAHKAAEQRSAIVRWLHQVRQLQDGVNIWHEHMFPNPPIFPITLYPLTLLDPVAAAVAWFSFKATLMVLAILMCGRMARAPGDERHVPSWALFAVILLSFRPLLGDLHHGNNNLVILFLVVGSLYAWRRGLDVLAGLALGLAIAYKVTPALFVPYFMYKGSWRTVGATFLGLGLFLLAVPSAVLGVEFNGQCLMWWWHRMMRPFVMEGEIGDHIINQSMAGVLMRYLTAQPPGDLRYMPPSGLNLAALDPGVVALMIKGLSVAMVGLLAWLCRTEATRRDDPRLLGEFSLVVLTMLIISERSWKHHYVTILLPHTYLIFRMWAFRESRRWRRWLAGGLGLSALLMLSTSSDVGGLFAGGTGHDLAQYYGMFFWAGVVLYVLTAAQLRRDQRFGAVPTADLDPSMSSPAGPAGPHFAAPESPSRIPAIERNG